MRVRNLAIAFLACAASYLGAQQVNPTTDINWPAATGAAAPVAGCPTATTGSTTNGSKAVVVASGGGVQVNQTVSGTGITAGTTVAAIFGTKVTLSANATATGTSVALNFYPLGRPYTVQSTGATYVCSLSGWVATGESGSFVALTGDATSTSTGGTTTVVGLNGTLLSGLSTGILKITHTTGVPSIAVAGTDYLTPAGAAALYAPIFTLTTTGSSGAATYSGNVLNIPQYSSGGGCSTNCTFAAATTGGVPVTVNGFSSGQTADLFDVFTYSGGSKVFFVSNTGAATATSLSLPGDGTHAAMTSFYPNTTVPTLTSGNFSLLGPNASSVTAFAWQFPTATNSSAGILHVGANSGAVSQLTLSPVSLTADVTGVLPVANGGSPAVADVTVAVPAATFNANTCTVGANSPLTMTGLTTTMTVTFTANSDTHATIGWGAPGAGVLYITDYPSAANTVTFYVCNNTISNITTSASQTFNVSAR
jgi:hypothetical protein